MRENCTSGTVRGALGNRRSYRGDGYRPPGDKPVDFAGKPGSGLPIDLKFE
ncbi:hypothetical protein M1N87_02405 [Dehalococcoidia bacterium]|nr:hypothetical protein [Dehalococcoidia bacterium]